MKDRDERYQYYLIACGTSDYQHLHPDKQLPGVKDEVETIVKIFTEKFGYTRVLDEFGSNPNRRILKGLADWLTADERTDKDIVVFYYSGHGVITPDGHYLMMEATEEATIIQTGLKTEELIKVLIIPELNLTEARRRKIKLKEILFIIDTCHAAGGGGDILKAFFDKIVPQLRYDRNIGIYVITSSLYKQTAITGGFANAFERTVNECFGEAKPYIATGTIIDSIKRYLKNQQNIQYHSSGGDGGIYLFPTSNLRDHLSWEDRCLILVNEFIDLLTPVESDTAILVAINSFIMIRETGRRLVRNRAEEFIRKIQEYARRAVDDDGICEMLLFSEWFCLYAEDLVNQEISADIVQNIRSWQDLVSSIKPNVKIDSIRREAEQVIETCELKNEKSDFRIQIEIEPQLEEEPSARITSYYHLNVSLWIRDKDLPLAFETNVATLRNKESSSIVNQLQALLPDIIERTHYCLLSADNIDISLEFFVPIDLYNVPIELIEKQRGREKVGIGEEYPTFINSYERYCDFGYSSFKSIRRALIKLKKKVWSESDLEVVPNFCNRDSLPQITPKSFFIYVGNDCSTRTLCEIEKNFIFALWSRDEQVPVETAMGNEIDRENWRDWHEILPGVRNSYRRRNQTLKLTHFRDDLFPKPSQRSRIKFATPR